MRRAFGHARAGGVDAGGFGDACLGEFIHAIGPFDRADVHRFAQIIGCHVPHEPPGVFGIDDSVLAAAVAVLVRGKHHHWRVERQVLPLAVGCEIGLAVFGNGGKPADRARHGAGFERAVRQRADVCAGGVVHRSYSGVEGERRGAACPPDPPGIFVSGKKGKRARPVQLPRIPGRRRS